MKEKMKEKAPKIKDLLLEMYPLSKKSILLQEKEYFIEWFRFLIDSDKWYLKEGVIEIDQIKYKYKPEIKKELKNYKSLVDYNHITVVEEIHNQNYGLVDGYHRVLLTKEKTLTGSIWKEQHNNHRNCQTIKNLILD